VAQPDEGPSPTALFPEMQLEDQTHDEVAGVHA